MLLLAMRITADVTGGIIAAILQSISGVSAINPLVAFYDLHGEKIEVLFFRDKIKTASNKKPHQNPLGFTQPHLSKHS
jgi:hypothetical protein